ncbi:MAG: winged helix-turn-helix domain-containing protein [Oscillospiraceae bacterium]
MPVMFPPPPWPLESGTVAGTGAGGDDYIAKALPPRGAGEPGFGTCSAGTAAGTKPLAPGSHIRVDAARGVVTKDGRELPLSPWSTGCILLFYAAIPGVVLSAAARILDEIWDLAGDFVTDNTLTVYMKRLRDKIEPDPQNPTLIRTIRGRGYKARGLPMKFLRDRELHVQLLLLLPLTMAAAGGWAFSRSHRSRAPWPWGFAPCLPWCFLGSAWEALPDHGGLVPGPGPDSPRGVRRGPGRAYDEGAGPFSTASSPSLLTRLRETGGPAAGDRRIKWPRFWPTSPTRSGRPSRP